MLRKKLFSVVLACVAFSCSDPVGDSNASGTGDITVIDNRLVFKTEDIYQATLNQLSIMTPDKRFEWTKQFSFNSLEGTMIKLESRDEYAEKYGWNSLNPAHSFVLNDQGLIQIGNDVVLYRNGNKYYQNVVAYNADKNSITRSANIASYGWQTGSTRVTDASARPITAPNNGLNDGTYGCGGAQHEFQLSDGSWRKWIYVFRGSYETFGPGGACGGSSANIRLWLCMEQYGRTKTSKPWSNTTDNRNLSWNVNLTSVVGRYAPQCNTGALTVPITSGLTNLSGTQNAATYHYFGVQVAYFGQIIDVYNTKTFSWTAQCTGTMTQTYPGYHTYTEDFGVYYYCPS